MNWRRVENEKRVWGGQKREDPDRTTSIVQGDDVSTDGALVTTPPVPARRKKERPPRKSTTPPAQPNEDDAVVDVPKKCPSCGERVPERYAAWHRAKKCRTKCPDCGLVMNTRKLYDHREKICPNRSPTNVGTEAKRIRRRSGVVLGGPHTKVCPACMQLVLKKRYRRHQATCPNGQR